jgi:hypothetical protein
MNSEWLYPLQGEVLVIVTEYYKTLEKNIYTKGAYLHINANIKKKMTWVNLAQHFQIEFLFLCWI